jgi:hypothetical protein
MKLRWTYMLAGAVALNLAGTAHAAVITFDDIPNTLNGIQTSVSSGGYDFDGLHFHIIDSPDDRFVRNASTSYLTAEAAGSLGKAVTMTKAGGGTFTLNQVDVAELWLPGEAANSFFDVFITGNQFGGGVLNMLVRLDGVRDGAGGVDDFQGVNFAGWSNLTSVVFTGINAAGAFGDYSIDNVVVDSVPEPASLTLMALGALASFARRRRQSRLR